MNTDLPSITLPCEWMPRIPNVVCGRPATWTITLHDSGTPGHGPNDNKVWLMCPDCALGVLRWAQREKDRDSGTQCAGCDTMLIPTLGAYVIASGELADPRSDIRYADLL